MPSIGLSELRVIEDPIDGAVISGQVQVTLSAALIQAIQSGVPLRFSSEFQVLERRWWWRDRVLFYKSRAADLSFHPLTRQFRVVIDGDNPLVYQDFSEALRASLSVKGWRVGSAGQMPVGGERRLRLSLDLVALPKAIQVTALTSEQWVFDTGWVLVQGSR